MGARYDEGPEVPRPITNGGLGFSHNFTVRTEARERLIRQIREVQQDVQAGPAVFTGDADEFQRKVILSRATTLRIIAPAGSGKTQTIANRVLTRIAGGLRPERILILTFDNSAARALQGRLDSDTTSSRAAVTTLNAFGYGILREYFPQEHGAIREQFQKSRFRHLRNELKTTNPDQHAALQPHLRDGFFLDLFGLLKNKLVDPRDLDYQRLADVLIESRVAIELFPDAENEQLVETTIEAIAELFTALDAELHAAKIIDFDDQKLRAYTGLRDRPTTAAAIRAKYDEVIVDEFQDINELDFALIELVARDRSLVVTGDDDQSIYGFRGTSPEFIIDLERHLGRSVEPHVLEVNYRCPANIVAHAVRLIEHNQHRLPKRQVPHRDEQADIKVVPSISSGIESRVLLDYIRDLLRGQGQSGPGVKPSDIAILYRTNAQSLPLQVELILADIPFQVREEDNILTNEALERLLGALRARSAIRSMREPRPDDAMHLVRGYFRSLRADEAEHLRSYFSRFPVWEVLHSPMLGEAVPKARESKLVEAIESLVYAESLSDAMGVMISGFHGMSGMVGSLEDAANGRAPLAEISEVAANFEDADEFVSTMERAIARAKTGSAGSDPEGVQLLTYFRSKGRQWHTVILVSCNEGLIPHRRSDLEEERRLFYVGLTRASKNLLVSYVDHAAGGRATASRFLSEAGLVKATAAPTDGTSTGGATTLLVNDRRMPIALYPLTGNTPDILCIQADGRLTPSGSGVIEAARGRRWARESDTRRPEFQFIRRPDLFTLPELLAVILKEHPDAEDVRARIDAFLARYPMDLAQSPSPPPASSGAQRQQPPPTAVPPRTEPSPSTPETLPAPPAEQSSARVVEGVSPKLREPAGSLCLAASDDVPPLYRWVPSTGFETLEIRGLGVLARSKAAADGHVDLVLPAAKKVQHGRLKNSIPWLERELDRISKLDRGDQGRAFRIVLYQLQQRLFS